MLGGSWTQIESLLSLCATLLLCTPSLDLSDFDAEHVRFSISRSELMSLCFQSMGPTRLGTFPMVNFFLVSTQLGWLVSLQLVPIPRASRAHYTSTWPRTGSDRRRASSSQEQKDTLPRSG